MAPGRWRDGERARKQRRAGERGQRIARRARAAKAKASRGVGRRAGAARAVQLAKHARHDVAAGRGRERIRSRAANLRRLRRNVRLAGIRRDEVSDQGGHPARMGQPRSAAAALERVRGTSIGPAGRLAPTCGAIQASFRASRLAQFVTKSRTPRSASATTTTIPMSSRITGPARARGTSWTAARSTARADRTIAGRFR